VLLLPAPLVLVLLAAAVAPPLLLLLLPLPPRVAGGSLSMRLGSLEGKARFSSPSRCLLLSLSCLLLSLELSALTHLLRLRAAPHLR
jgi:hypothetical protein